MVFTAELETESIRLVTGELFADEPMATLLLTGRDEPASQEPISPPAKAPQAGPVQLVEETPVRWRIEQHGPMRVPGSGRRLGGAPARGGRRPLPGADHHCGHAGAL